jgi:hypothetical protein
VSAKRMGQCPTRADAHLSALLCPARSFKWHCDFHVATIGNFLVLGVDEPFETFYCEDLYSLFVLRALAGGTPVVSLHPVMVDTVPCGT